MQFTVIWELSGIVDWESLLESIVTVFLLIGWKAPISMSIGKVTMDHLLVGGGLGQGGDVLFQLLHVGLEAAHGW